MNEAFYNTVICDMLDKAFASGDRSKLIRTHFAVRDFVSILISLGYPHQRLLEKMEADCAHLRIEMLEILCHSKLYEPELRELLLREIERGNWPTWIDDMAALSAKHKCDPSEVYFVARDQCHLGAK